MLSLPRTPNGLRHLTVSAEPTRLRHPSRLLFKKWTALESRHFRNSTSKHIITAILGLLPTRRVTLSYQLTSARACLRRDVSTSAVLSQRLYFYLSPSGACSLFTTRSVHRAQ